MNPTHRIGRLGKPNGLDGFIGLYVDAENLGHFETQAVVIVDDRPLTVRALRSGKKGPQVAFTEIVSREGAEAIRGLDVFAENRRPLGEHEYWPEDLVGLDVRPGGGVVVGVNHGPSQDRLEVERDGGRFEVPFVSELVPVVDLEAGFIEIVELEGLSEPPNRV